MRKFEVNLLVEYESGLYIIPVFATDPAEAGNKAIIFLLDEYPIFRNRKIKISSIN
jgi:hypothetical protein